jgi:hypothetical protein
MICSMWLNFKQSGVATDSWVSHRSTMRRAAAKESVGPITRRSQVQILPSPRRGVHVCGASEARKPRFSGPEPGLLLSGGQRGVSHTVGLGAFLSSASSVLTNGSIRACFAARSASACYRLAISLARSLLRWSCQEPIDVVRPCRYLLTMALALLGEPLESHRTATRAEYTGPRVSKRPTF